MNKFFILSLGLLLSSGLFAELETSRKVLNSKLLTHANEIGIIKSPSNQELDALAQHYCKQHTNTLVTIIWPRAQENIETIKAIMEPNCTLIYQKGFSLENDGLKYLDHFAHKSKTVKEIHQHAILYGPADIIPPYKCYAILFETDMKSSDVRAMKKEIRNKVGSTYFSIHIDDRNRQSQRLAEKVFDDSVLDAICQKPF